MKGYFFIFFLFFFLLGCKKKAQEAGADWNVISENIQYQRDKSVFNVKSGGALYSIPADKLPLKKIILLNASLAGYLAELDLEDRIIGISSPEYVYSPKIGTLISSGKIHNVGNEQKYNVEKIIALKPDAVITNYVASFSNTYDLLKKNGIELIFLNEYLEQKPLDKTKYLLVFGELLGRQQQAERRVREIRNAYDSLKLLVASNATSKPLVLANDMYGNHWFLPGGKTNLANLLRDAGAQYINASNPDEKAVPMSFEEVFAKAENATFWVNVGNHRLKKELLQINPNYAKMNVYNHGELYTVSGREDGSSNDYFESGVVRADLLLKDYIRIFHPGLLPNYTLTYLKPLK